MDNGFIMLSRKFFSHRIWRASRTFSEGEAWIDLIQSARFDATRLTASIGGRKITFGRGQYPASIKYLSEKWGWNSEKRVRNFLNELKKEGMITTDSSQGMNIITLCNYDTYNNAPSETHEGEPKGKANYVTDSELNRELGKLKGELLEAIGNLGQDWGKKKNKENKDKDSSSKPPTPLKGDFDLSYVRDDFRATMESWISYKREIKNSYRSDRSVRFCYNNLVKLSGADPERARLIVEQSVANGWKGLFELKQTTNTTNGRTDKQTTGAAGSDMEAFYRHIAEGIARADYEERERRE